MDFYKDIEIYENEYLKSLEDEKQRTRKWFDNKYETWVQQMKKEFVKQKYSKPGREPKYFKLNIYYPETKHVEYLLEKFKKDGFEVELDDPELDDPELLLYKRDGRNKKSVLRIYYPKEL